MSLDDLRQSLGEIDRQILALAAERQRLARLIGHTKQQAGKPTRDFVQERRVIERARNHARTLALSPDVASSLLGALIRDSLSAQEHDQVQTSAGGAGRSALVVGGAGKMGCWFARFLASQGFHVTIADPNAPVEGFPSHADWHDLPLDHEIIVIAAPLPATGEILHDLAKHPPAGTVFDIGSLKSPIRSGLRALADAGGHVTSVHPMFGPSTALLSGRHVIFVDLGDSHATQSAKALFAPTMATQMDMDLDDHDRLIAYVLGLSHALNLAFVSALANSGEHAVRLANLSSTTFDAQLDVARRVVSENPHLYFEIQALNDYGSTSLDALQGAVDQIRELVSSNDQAGFVRLMRQCQVYTSDASPQQSPGSAG